MSPASETVFYLLCDLSDALADLSIAMNKWHMELEMHAPDADNEGVLAALHAIQSILNEVKHCEK